MLVWGVCFLSIPSSQPSQSVMGWILPRRTGLFSDSNFQESPPTFCIAPVCLNERHREMRSVSNLDSYILNTVNVFSQIKHLDPGSCSCVTVLSLSVWPSTSIVWMENKVLLPQSSTTALFVSKTNNILIPTPPSSCLIFYCSSYDLYAV